MSRPPRHTRLLPLTPGMVVGGGRLHRLDVLQIGRRRDLLMDFAELQLAAPRQLAGTVAAPRELVRGRLIRKEIRFTLPTCVGSTRRLRLPTCTRCASI